jgi:hypothetical protein
VPLELLGSNDPRLHVAVLSGLGRAVDWHDDTLPSAAWKLTVVSAHARARTLAR